MSRPYGNGGLIPFASVDDCMQTTEYYDTNKRLHHFAYHCCVYAKMVSGPILIIIIYVDDSLAVHAATL